MGFRAVVRKTLIDLTGWKRTLILLVLGLFIPVLTSVFWRFSLQNANLSPDMAKYDVLERFIGISFIWTTGLFLAFAVVTSAAGAISKESSDGTLLTLVSKPIARRQIVLGKFTGIVIHSFLMITVILLIQAVILWFLLPVEAPTFGALLLAIPWLILYSLLVILVFASISLALSSLIDNQVVITVLACGLIFFTFIFGSISNMMFMMKPQAYEDNYVYMIDGSYQFGNAFAPALEQALGGEMLPPRELEEITYFAGIFKGGRMGDVYGDSSEYQYPGELANYVPPAVSAALFMVLVAGCLTVAVVMTERKDVG
jgi:ABC-type transport system involved in multi-copper enzyme maturation permease subunit